jgi:predicted phage-related endonuclease
MNRRDRDPFLTRLELPSQSPPNNDGSSQKAWDVRAALQELAEPWTRGDRVKAAIARAARRAGLSYWRAFDIWYGKARRIEDHEMDAIAAALEKRRKEVSRNELSDLKTRLARLEAHLVATDEDFHRPTLDRLRASDGGLGGMDRALVKRRG